MTCSDARLAANRRNAAKSTGPKTAEGKARSARNSWKHGLYARPPVAPGEAADEYRARVDAWLDAGYAPAGDPAARDLVERAVQASWRLDRCARAEAARLAHAMRHAAVDFDRDEADRAEKLGRRLVLAPDPWGRIPDRPAGFPDPNEPDDPPTVLRALESFAHGADWLLARWHGLAAVLDRDAAWDEPEKFLAVRLLGKVPNQALTDPALGELFLCTFVASPPYWRFDDDLRTAGAWGQGRPLQTRRLEALEASAPTPAAATAALRALVAAQVARLERLKSESLDPVAALDRSEAADRASFDSAPGSASLRRYEVECTRAFHRALADLHRLRLAALQPAPEPEPEPEPEAPVSTPPEPTPGNEANPEVVDDEPVPSNTPRTPVSPFRFDPPSPPLPPSTPRPGPFEPGSGPPQ